RRRHTRLQGDWSSDVCSSDLLGHSHAEVVMRLAVHLRPDFAQAHHNLGVAMAELGQLDEAALCLRQALTLQPDYAEAYYNLGNEIGRASCRERVERSVAAEKE